MNPKPKPKKEDRKRIKEKQPKAKKAKNDVKKFYRIPRLGKSDRSAKERKIDSMCRAIVFWRDGNQCVQRWQGSCGGILEWGHLIPRGRSGYLAHSLSNTFVQCHNHNMIHTVNDAPYRSWFLETFGLSALEELDRINLSRFKGLKLSWSDLYEIENSYTFLLSNIHSVNGATLAELVQKGYYGEIIKNNHKTSLNK